MKQSRGGVLPQAKRIIGVTGHTGSGASSFAKFLEDYGGLVISADKLAHEELNKDSSAFLLLIESFTEAILNSCGEINRGALAAMVFGKGNEENLKKLEGIIHPAVLKKTRKIIEENASDLRSKFIVIDAPLLVESGLNEDCDLTVFVRADKQVRVLRIMKRDRIDFISAERRIESRIEPDYGKIDLVIENNGSLDDLHNAARGFIMSHD